MVDTDNAGGDDVGVCNPAVDADNGVVVYDSTFDLDELTMTMEEIHGSLLAAHSLKDTTQEVLIACNEPFRYIENPYFNFLYLFVAYEFRLVAEWIELVCWRYIADRGLPLDCQDPQVPDTILHEPTPDPVCRRLRFEFSVRPRRGRKTPIAMMPVTNLVIDESPRKNVKRKTIEMLDDDVVVGCDEVVRLKQKLKQREEKLNSVPKEAVIALLPPPTPRTQCLSLP